MSWSRVLIPVGWIALGYSFIKRYFRLTPVVLASVFVAYLLSVTVGFHNREAAVNMGGMIGCLLNSPP